MAESLREIVTRKEQELHQKLAALQREIDIVRFELEEVERVKAALTPEWVREGVPEPSLELAYALMPGAKLLPAHLAQLYSQSDDNPPMSGTLALFANLTIKDLILRALAQHFPSGATASELIDFIANGYGRLIERQSFSPQLSRLKDEGMIVPRDGAKWLLTKEGKRAFKSSAPSME